MSAPASTAAVADILSGFTQETIPLRPDDEGELVATLVRHGARAGTGRAVLYLHGYVDYFFQVELATRYAQHGFDFYALDLRRYGRSLLPHQKPNFVLSLSDHFEEIDVAIDLIRNRDAHSFLLLNGHSTGGLTGALYAHARNADGAVDALFLNSPFLDMNDSWLTEHVGVPLASAVGAVDPDRELPSALSPLYFESVHRDFHGEWDFRTDWKPRAGFPMYAGWARAVHHAQAELQSGLAVEVPVLVMHSAESSRRTAWDDVLLRTDSVLDVTDIARYAGSIGREVTTISVAGGMHDLVLSAPAVRERVYGELFAWLARRFGAAPAASDT